MTDWIGVDVTKPTCSVEGCERVAYSRGYCNMHYQRVMRIGDPGEASERRATRNPTCSEPGCSRPHASKGYCALHYRRLKAGTYMGIAAYGQRRVGECVMPDCESKIYANRLCNPHYSRCRAFSLSPVQLMQLVTSGVCDICGGPAVGKNANVDHDHRCCEGNQSCGECIRGLLCGSCNRGIGLLGDDPGVLLSAARYLGLAS